jgi:hypothetical protein
MNFASRVLKVTALSYEQFRKWDRDKQVDYLNRHPESDFRLPESKGKHEDNGAPPATDQPGVQSGPGAQPQQPAPGPQHSEPGPSRVGNAGGPATVPRSADVTTDDYLDPVANPLADLLDRGVRVVNKRTNEEAVRMDYEQSRDLIDDYLARGWALKYDLAKGSQLQKGDRVITLTTESTGNSLVRVSKADENTDE